MENLDWVEVIAIGMMNGLAFGLLMTVRNPTALQEARTASLLRGKQAPCRA